jgi:hypothetical protein
LPSFGRLVLEQPVAARTLEFHSLTAHAELAIDGAALIDGEGQIQQLFGSTLKTRYREVYQADGIVVLESSAVFPRAFAVQSSRLAPDGQSLEAIQRLAFAPHGEVGSSWPRTHYQRTLGSRWWARPAGQHRFHPARRASTTTRRTR